MTHHGPTAQARHLFLFTSNKPIPSHRREIQHTTHTHSNSYIHIHIYTNTHTQSRTLPAAWRYLSLYHKSQYLSVCLVAVTHEWCTYTHTPHTHTDSPWSWPGWLWSHPSYCELRIMALPPRGREKHVRRTKFKSRLRGRKCQAVGRQVRRVLSASLVTMAVGMAYFQPFFSPHGHIAFCLAPE